MARVFADGGAQSLAAASSKIVSPKDWSVALFLKRTATPAATRSIVSALDAAGDSGFFVWMTTGNLIQAGSVYVTTDKSRSSSTAPALNTWVHVIVVHMQTGTANTDFTFYFDGKSEAGTSVTTGSGTHTDNLACPFVVGNDSVAALLAPPAQIGPIAFWERAISPAEALALAGGAHPLRFKEGLVEIFDMATAHGEEGWLKNLYLVQGATNPTSAAVSPPVEGAPLSLLETRQNVRPTVRSRARYNVVAASAFISDDDFFPPIQMRDEGRVLLVA
jgi:hypothetical protein